MSQYFSKPYKSQEEILGKIRIYEENINVKVDLSSYATKPDLKNVTHHDTSSFALTTNLASLKTEVDKLDVDKLVPALVDLSKLNNVVKNVVKNGVVKKAAYDKLVTKVINIDNSGFVVKLESELEEKLLSLLKKQITIIKLLK